MPSVKTNFFEILFVILYTAIFSKLLSFLSCDVKKNSKLMVFISRNILLLKIYYFCSE